MDFIYSAIGKFLGWLDSATGSYVLALFIFAIIVELVMLPFGIRQQKNSIKQATLRPKEMAIRKKYAGRNDQPTQQKMMQEIQELYQREGYSPMGGCLPMLLQFPIIIILYNTVINPLRHMMGMTVAHIEGLAKFVGDKLGTTFDTRNTINLVNRITQESGGDFETFLSGLKTTDLVEEGEAIYTSALDAFRNVPNFNLFGLNLADQPQINVFNWLWIIPILTFAVYFATMKLNRKLSYQPTTANDPQVGCSNNVMDITMPLMSVWISFMVPAVIGVYWIFKSLLSTLKQFILTRLMPLPTFTEEDYKAAEKEMKGKNKTAGNRGYVSDGTKPRSLHHIDDDDYDQPTPAPKKSEPQKPESGAASLVAAAPLKKDNKDESKKSDDKKDNEEVSEPKTEDTPTETEK